jgi:hypothetical protein
MLIIKPNKNYFTPASRDVQLRAQYKSSFALTVLENPEKEVIKI